MQFCSHLAPSAIFLAPVQFFSRPVHWEHGSSMQMVRYFLFARTLALYACDCLVQSDLLQLASKLATTISTMWQFALSLDEYHENWGIDPITWRPAWKRNNNDIININDNINVKVNISTSISISINIGLFIINKSTATPTPTLTPTPMPRPRPASASASSPTEPACT